MNRTALQDRRVWIGGGAVVALLLIVASWFLLISPELSSASDLHGQADDADAQNMTLQVKINQLAKKNHDIAKLEAKLGTALDSLPPTTGLPEFTNQVAATAKLTSVSLRSIAVGTISQVGVATPGAAASPSPAASGGSAQPSATPTTPAAAAGTGQYSIAVTVSSAGAPQAQAVFLKALEDGPRRVLVTSSNLSFSGTRTTMTTQLVIYSAPMSPAQVKDLKKSLQSH